MKKNALRSSVSKGDRVIAIHNHYRGHRHKAAMAKMCRVALRGLSGPWDIWIMSAGRDWFRLEIVGPRGTSWSMAVPFNALPSSEDLAEALRAACIRHSPRIRRDTPRRGLRKGVVGAYEADGARSRALPALGDEAHRNPGAVASGTSK